MTPASVKASRPLLSLLYLLLLFDAVSSFSLYTHLSSYFILFLLSNLIITMGVFTFSDTYYENDEPLEIESVKEQGDFDIDSDTFDADLSELKQELKKLGWDEPSIFGGTREGVLSRQVLPRRVLQSTNLNFYVREYSPDECSLGECSLNEYFPQRTSNLGGIYKVLPWRVLIGGVLPLTNPHFRRYHEKYSPNEYSPDDSREGIRIANSRRCR